MVNNSDLGWILRWVALPAAVASLMFTPFDAHASDRVRMLEQEPAHVSSLEGVSEWMMERFSESEIAALSAEDLGVESHLCSCADKPEPHYPYRIVLFTTPRGDLVARAEAHEQSPRITPLAVRNGEQYCTLESEEPCYGSFATVCEFTDFRFGPLLAPYFPTCK
jgi:hypothetical protein